MSHSDKILDNRYSSPSPSIQPPKFIPLLTIVAIANFCFGNLAKKSVLQTTGTKIGLTHQGVPWGLIMWKLAPYQYRQSLALDSVQTVRVRIPIANY